MKNICGAGKQALPAFTYDEQHSDQAVADRSSHMWRARKTNVALETAHSRRRRERAACIQGSRNRKYYEGDSWSDERPTAANVRKFSMQAYFSGAPRTSPVLIAAL